MDRVLRHAAVTLEVTFYDGETVVDPGTVTVHVVRDDATDVKPAGTTTIGTGAAKRAVTLTAGENDRVDVLTATWTSATLGKRITAVEVVGGFYATLAQLRALDGLANTTRFPTSTLATARGSVETSVEEFCGVAFVPRYKRETVTVEDGELFIARMFPRKVLWAKDDDTTLTVSGWTVHSHGVIEVDNVADGTRVTVGYEHGWDSPPADLADAALSAVRHKLLDDKSGVSPRAITLTNEFGNVSFSTPGRDRCFGLPDADATIVRHRHTIPGIG